MDLIKEINEKYIALEADIDKKLDKATAEELKLERETRKLTEASTAKQPVVLSYEEALLRNTNLLKSLEISKARLRSRSTFSPVEKLLKGAIKNYKNEWAATAEQQQQTMKDTNKAKANNTNKDVDEAEGLYELLMQNVVEANKKGNSNLA